METLTAALGTKGCLNFPSKQQEKVNIKSDTESPSKTELGKIKQFQQSTGEASVQCKVGTSSAPGTSSPSTAGRDRETRRASGTAALSQSQPRDPAEGSCRIPYSPSFPEVWGEIQGSPPYAPKPTPTFGGFSVRSPRGTPVP